MPRPDPPVTPDPIPEVLPKPEVPKVPTREERRKQTVAIEAAVTDDRRAEWKPRRVIEDGQSRLTPATDAFTREDIAALREAGATRLELLEYARHAGLTDMQVEVLDADLDSYGAWD